MSRIGYKAIELPQGVEVSQSGNVVTVKGPKGTLSREISPLIKMNVTDSEVTFERENDDKKAKMVHGTTRANVNNMIEGVVNGFKKTLKLVGVGYRAQMQGKKLIVSAGYSHNVEMDVPEGLKVELPKNTQIIISGIDKQVVGQFAAEIRDIRKPEPYKGKGIKYDYEVIRRKEGKTAKK